MAHTRMLPAAALSLLLASPAFAEDDPVQSVRQEIARMRQDYEARIQRLERRLAQAEAASRKTATAQRTATAAGEPPASQMSSPPRAGLRARANPEPPVDSGAAAHPGPTVADAAPAAARPASSNNLFNPAIGVVLNGMAAASRRDPSAYQIPGFMLGPDARPAARGLSLGESEINLSANIDQVLYGNLTVSLASDNTVSLEEAFIQTTGLPWGFTVKAGRFKSGIGYLNEQHAHTWDFVDAPLPYLAMLNQQYGDDGVQIRWLAPTKMFVELGAEALRGDSWPAGGAANKGFGSFSAFAHIGDDIGEGGEGGSWRLGVSELWTKAAGLTNGTDTFDGNDRLTIVDAIYKWAPNGNFADRYVKLQGEYFYRDQRGSLNGVPGSTQQQGFYVQAVWQFMPRWRVGIRHDQVWGRAQNGPLAGSTWDAHGSMGSRQSIMVDYSTSEFGRFRLQGNLDHSTGKYDPQVVLQYTVSLGAHGAHSY